MATEAGFRFPLQAAWHKQHARLEQSQRALAQAEAQRLRLQERRDELAQALAAQSAHARHAMAAGLSTAGYQQAVAFLVQLRERLAQVERDVVLAAGERDRLRAEVANRSARLDALDGHRAELQRAHRHALARAGQVEMDDHWATLSLWRADAGELPC